MSFLNTKRTTKSFEQVLQSKKPGTRRGFKTVFSNFEKFCKEKHQRNMEEIVREFLKVEQVAVINTLQEWINFNKNKSPKTITTWFSYLSKYLRHRGVDLTNVKDNLDFPRYIEEEKYPLSQADIQKILSVAGYDMKLKLLTQLSSGMRRGEMLQLRKKDLIIDKRIIIKIPAKIAKFNKARTTFVSSEVQKILIPKLRGLNDNDFVFGSPDVQEKNIGDSYEQNLIRYLEKLGLDMRYESTNYHKINTHSFRAYFITKISRHDENIAKILSGQKGYLLQYDRLTVEEKLAKFIEFEPDLYIFKSKPESQEINDLKENQEKDKETIEIMTGILDEMKNEQQIQRGEIDYFKDKYVIFEGIEEVGLEKLNKLIEKNTPFAYAKLKKAYAMARQAEKEMKTEFREKRSSLERAEFETETGGLFNQPIKKTVE